MKPLQTFLASALILFSSQTTSAQTANVPARVKQPVDVENLVTLQGNTHPLASPEFDQGAAPDSLPMERMLLVLQRSPEQETALRQLLDEQQIRSSPHYHMWLTPEQFGEQFGPADADIQAVTGWLASQGFQVIQVAAGRTVIEFSGTAGAVRQAFHTEMHKYVVEGEERWANASDPQIPAALAPVVAGFASLNNFPRQPTMQRAGAFSRSKATGEVKPLFTVPSSSGNYYALGPTDFATIYNVLPLWQPSQATQPIIDGTGQTIAIVAESNINVQDASDFRNVFGLPANDPQIILNGPDPGLNGTETEADLDVEWAGAVAKNATIDLVVSQSTEATAGIDLSALYIIDNNLAPIMSVSYGYCEPFLGVGGNAFQNALHEQGAAQGITIINSAGDSGSARCDQGRGEVAAQYGLAVSGLASTPFNVAVGGTDFNDVNDWYIYWSSTNNTTTLSSALSYIPEMTWNNTCARYGVESACSAAGVATPTGVDLVAGGGGASNCVTSSGSGTSVTCTAGYPKPAWQSGTGVPDDAARDIPDVSLFASNGFNRSFYVVCEADALPAGYPSCNRSNPNWYFLGIGGTSASAPAFAGIMALVNQKTGERQGNANYVLYPLAAKSGASCTSGAAMAATANSSACIFYDVPSGYNNSVACMGGSPNCSNTTSGDYGILEVNPPTNPSPAWSTTAGYDLATGLGSVNAANLVNNWTSVSFRPTTTTLANLTPTILTHGQAVNFAINVAPSSGSGTPTGDVSLIAQAGSSPSNSTGIGSFTLSNGSFSGTTNMLPGGTYGVTAHYAGDGAFGASDSTPPVQVTVSPEGSQTRVALLTFDPVTGRETSSNATTVAYGSLYLLRVDVTNNSGHTCFSIPYACPTGQVSLTDNGQPLDLGSYKLNSQGYTEDQLVQLAIGSNSVVASYFGDTSYNASTSPTDAITYTKAPTTTTLSGLPSSVVAQSTISFNVTVNTQSRGLAPSGNFEILDGTTPVGAGGDYIPTNGSATAFASLQADLLMSLPPGPASVTAQYPGDINYAESTSAATTLTVTDFSVSANPTTVNISAPGQSGTTTLTLTPQYGFTGTVTLGCGFPGAAPGLSCTVSPSSVNVTGSSPLTATVTFTTTAQVSATAPAPPRRVPPGLRLPVGRFWLWAALLALATLMSLAAARQRPAGSLFAGALLVVGIWVACGGGSGGSSPPPPAPVVSLSPASIAFSQQNVGSTSAAQTVTLSNIGNASLSISGIAIGGTNSGDFTQTNNCGTSVAAGAACTISVTFTPSAAGARSASLNITDNASGSPQTVSLTGTGAQQPVVNLSPTSLTFGQENMTLTSPAQSLTLSNTGSALLVISSIALGGAAPFDFAQTNTCSGGVAPGANCAISVTFTPTATGTRSASLGIADNAQGSPQTVGLTGTGILPPTPPGTYQIYVTGSSGGDMHTVYGSLNVQ